MKTGLFYLLLTFVCFNLSYAQTFDLGKDYGLVRIDDKGNTGPNFLSNNVTVVIFYSPECPICLSNTKTISELAAKYEGKANFYLVYPGTYYSTGFIRKFQRKYKLKVASYKDPNKNLVSALQAGITPQAFIINSKGRIMYMGKIDNQYEEIGKRRTVTTEFYLQNALDSVLKGEEPATQFTQAVGCFIEK